MMTIIELKPHRNGWKVLEAAGIESVFPRFQDYTAWGSSLPLQWVRVFFKVNSGLVWFL
jgi:hypothetical protein